MLFPYTHFIKEKPRFSVFFSYEKHIPYIDANAALERIIILPVADHRLVVSVEGHTDDLPFAFMTGLPLFPPVMSHWFRKATGTSFSSGSAHLPKSFFSCIETNPTGALKGASPVFLSTTP